MRKYIPLLFVLFRFTGAEAQHNNDSVFTAGAGNGYSLSIRLYTSSYIPASNKIYELRCRDNKWYCRLYQANMDIPVAEISNDSIVIAAFDKLRLNRVFSLPSQEELPVKGTIDDGIDYRLEFTEGEKTGSYFYSNPELYLKTNKAVNELLLFSNIIKVFEGMFESYKKSRKPLRKM